MLEHHDQPAPAAPERPALEALDRRDWDAALTLLMEAYGQQIYRYCCQMMADSHLAEDVLQETFIQVHGGLRRFGRRSSLKTWIYAIAHNRCLDALKKERRRKRRVEWTDDPPDAADSSPDAECHAAAKEIAEVLRRCIAELSAPVRAAILFRLQAEMSYPEMSRVFGDQPATLQARVARAMPVLRECVERQGLKL